TSDLDPGTRRQLERGRRLQEVLKQDETSPLTLEQQVSIFYIATHGHLDDVPVSQVGEFESRWYEYAAANIPDVLRDIAETGNLTDETQAKLDEAIKAFKQTNDFSE